MPARKKKRNLKSKKVSQKRKKKTSWRKLKLWSQIKRKFKLLGLALIVFLATLVVSTAVSIYQFLKSPLAQAEGAIVREEFWSGETPLNIVLILLDEYDSSSPKIDYLGVLHLDPYEGSAKITQLSVETEVAVADFGPHRWRAVYALGELTYPKTNAELVVKTVSEHTRLSAESYLLIDQEGLKRIGSVNFEDLAAIFDLRNIPKVLQALVVGRSDFKTNLSLWEIGRVIKFLFSVRSDRFEILGEESSADSFCDERIVEERLKIIVLNGTAVPGLAAKAAEIIKNVGGDVLEVGNAATQDLAETVLVTEDLNSYTAQRIYNIFDIKTVRKPKTALEKRGDVVLILGLDKVENM